MDNVIKIVDIKGEDPILRKGDMVRLVIAGDYEDPDYNLELAEHCLDACGFVIHVQQRYGEDSEAPNQAMKFSVAFPFEDGWEELTDIEIYAVRRILNKELHLAEKEEINGNE